MAPFLGIVQFPHPGAEHRVGPDGFTPWNTGIHARKFLKVNGSFVDRNGGVGSGPLVCWAEWEAPSKLVSRLESKPGYPMHLVEPCLPQIAHLEPNAQNTDPYIFGERFHYTYCKQVRSSTWNATKLSTLAPGTLLLFGSHLSGDFVLDTVFVVADSVSHSRDSWQHELSGFVSDTYRRVTLEPMYADAIPPQVRLNLHRGATLRQPVNGTHSFFPCLPVRDASAPSFARPRIDIDGVVNPLLKQGMKTVAADRSTVAEVWREVVRQVESQGLMLGLSADEPHASCSE